MMHYEQYVVAITNPNGKAYREFESERLLNGRKSKVYLPFDSEYKILIKNNSDRRVKLTVDLDGTSISGMGGLILDAYNTESLERFVDVAKKFLFVRSNDGRVSDPSSSDNGILKIKMEREYAFPSFLTTTTVWTEPRYIINNFDSMHYTSVNALYASNQPIGVCKSDLAGAAPSCESSQANYSCHISRPDTSIRGLVGNKQLLNEVAGATVEGGDSSQKFETTTWAGTEGAPYEFIFKLLGQQGVSDEERMEYQKYLELKKRFEG